MTAYFTDLDGHPRRAAALFASLCGHVPDEGWKRLAVELAADDPRSGYLVLELGLLQPEQYADYHPRQTRRLFNQDIRGTAWFDDIRVSQVPAVDCQTERPGNIFRRDDRCGCACW